MTSCFACFRICSSADEERDRRQREALRELEDIQSKPLECGKKAIDARQPATCKAATTLDASPSSSVDLESLNDAPSVDIEPNAGTGTGRSLPAHVVSSRSRVAPLNEAPRPPTTSQSSLSSSPNGNRRTASLNPSPAPSPRTSNHGLFPAAATSTATVTATASSGELSTPSPHSHHTAAASPGAGSESTATPRLLPPSFLMHSPHGAATSALVTPHSARTPAAAGDAAACSYDGCSTPAGASREALPSPHGPMNGGRAPRSSPAAEPGPSPPQQQRASPQHSSPNVSVEEGGAAHAPRLGLATAKSAPVHGSPPVLGAGGGSGHEGGQDGEGGSVRRERRRRSEALARVDEEEAAEVERPAAPAVQAGQLRLLTEEAFLATVAAAAPALAQPAQEAARSAGVRSVGCLAGGQTEQRFAEAGWMTDSAEAPEGPRERERLSSAAACGAPELAPSPSGSVHASRRVSEAAGQGVAAVDAAMHASLTPSAAGCKVPPQQRDDVEPSPLPAQPAASTAPSPAPATAQRSPAPPAKHAWPAAAVAAARGSRPTSVQPQQQPSRSPAAVPRTGGTPTPAPPQQLRPSPSSRQPGPSTDSPVAAAPARRAPFAAAAASPAAAAPPGRSPAPGPTARGGAGAAAASASPFVSMYGSAASGRLRSTPPPPHAFSMQASASTRLALQDVLSARRSMTRGAGAGGFSSSMSVSGLGGNIDFRPKWRF